MYIGSQVWSGINNGLNYGFQKLDDGAFRLSDATFLAVSTIFQTRPESYFVNRFSPFVHNTLVKISDNRHIINLASNLLVVTSNSLSKNIGLDVVFLVFQLFIDTIKNTKVIRFLTVMNAVSIGYIGSNQFLDNSRFSILNRVLSGSVFVNNVCYNSYKINNRF